MQTYLIGLLALGMSAPQGSDLEKAEILERVNRAGIRREQNASLLQAAQAIGQAKADYQRAVGAAASDERLQGVIAALAAGSALTSEQQQVLQAARTQRRQLDTAFQSKVEASVKSAMAVLDNEQRLKLAISPEERRRVTDTISQIRSADNQAFERLSRNLVGEMMRPEMERIRLQMRRTPTEAAGAQRVRGRGDRGREQGRDNPQMRAQMQELQRVAQERLRKVRAGDAAATRDLEQMLVLSRGRERAEQRLHQEILAIIGSDASVAALSMRG